MRHQFYLITKGDYIPQGITQSDIYFVENYEELQRRIKEIPADEHWIIWTTHIEKGRRMYEFVNAVSGPDWKRKD